jgi:hypothetical protein
MLLAERPMPSTAATALGFCFASALTAAVQAFHQSSGACSDHPGLGRETLSGDVALAMMRWR